MTDHVQPDWSCAPDWANFWAVDSDGYAYWYRDQPIFDCDRDRDVTMLLRSYKRYRDQPEFDCDRDDTSSAGGWLHPSTDGVWLRPWETRKSSGQMDVKYDSSWPPEEFDNWDIEWDKTLRSR